MTIGIDTMVSVNLEAPHSGSGPLSVEARTAKIKPTDRVDSFVGPLMVWMTRWRERFIRPAATEFRAASMVALGLPQVTLLLGRASLREQEPLRLLLGRLPLGRLVRVAEQEPSRPPLVRVAEQGSFRCLGSESCHPRSCRLVPEVEPSLR